MTSSITLLLIGGSISLVSSLCALAASHWFELKRVSRQVKQHPTQVIYDKQAQFFEQVAPILGDINSYITTINVWLGEQGRDAKDAVEKAAANSASLTTFHELVERYYLYLPQRVLKEANGIFAECLSLERLPSIAQTDRCIRLLFAFQNSIREVVGVGSVSRDLARVFGLGSRETETKGGL